MTEKIKSGLTASYMSFIFEFADISHIDKAAISTAIKFPIEELFDSQKKADSCKRLGKDLFNKAVAAYFSKFQNADGIDHVALAKAIAANKKVLLRHLGKADLRYLTLLTSLFESPPKEMAKVRRGLLYAVGE